MVPTLSFQKSVDKFLSCRVLARAIFGMILRQPSFETRSYASFHDNGSELKQFICAKWSVIRGCFATQPSVGCEAVFAPKADFLSLFLRFRDIFWHGYSRSILFKVLKAQFMWLISKADRAPRISTLSFAALILKAPHPPKIMPAHRAKMSSHFFLSLTHLIPLLICTSNNQASFWFGGAFLIGSFWVKQ